MESAGAAVGRGGLRGGEGVGAQGGVFPRRAACEPLFVFGLGGFWGGFLGKALFFLFGRFLGRFLVWEVLFVRSHVFWGGVWEKPFVFFGSHHLFFGGGPRKRQFFWLLFPPPVFREVPANKNPLRTKGGPEIPISGDSLGRCPVYACVFVWREGVEKAPAARGPSRLSIF